MNRSLFWSKLMLLLMTLSFLACSQQDIPSVSVEETSTSSLQNFDKSGAKDLDYFLDIIDKNKVDGLHTKMELWVEGNGLFSLKSIKTSNDPFENDDIEERKRICNSYWQNRLKKLFRKCVYRWLEDNPRECLELIDYEDGWSAHDICN